MKYIGSKARLAKDLSPLFNELIKGKQINTYIEPFVGGANMIQHIVCENRIGSDNNEYLVHMWNAIKSGWVPPKEITKEFYEEIKQNKEKFPKELVAIVGFCASYNAKWFRGYAGEITTKTGKMRNYYDEAIRNILKQVDKIKDVDFVYADYTHFSNCKNALIYCDPPYQGTTRYITSRNFDYDKFWEWVRVVSANNIVLVSEYNAPDDFEVIFEKSLTTTLSKNSSKKDTEKLFKYKPAKNH